MFYQGIEGKFNSEAYQAFLLSVLTQTHEHVLLIQDGGRYHTSKATQAFFAEHAERLSVFQLPSDSPDYNPIEYLLLVHRPIRALKIDPHFDTDSFPY